MASEEQPPPYYFSFANLSCGFLDGLCQTEEDEEYIAGEPKMDTLPSLTEAPGPREPASEPAAERPPMARQPSRRTPLQRPTRLHLHVQHGVRENEREVHFGGVAIEAAPRKL